jgi:hypothetical protein
MDAFDYADAQKAPSARRTVGLVWNILTILVLLLTLCVGVAFLVVFINPQVSFNPFKPPPTTPELPTPTPTFKSVIQLPPTWTPAPTLEPMATFTPKPTFTPYYSPTPYVPPSPTATQPTPVNTTTPVPGGMSFVVQQGMPKAIANVYHLEAGCNWMGVAGRASSLNDAPVVGLFVQLGGTLEGRPYEKLSMTGTATQYGQSGFEFQLADHTIATKGTLWVQLLDQQNLPLSDKVYFDTYADCEKNLIIIYFQQVK